MSGADVQSVDGVAVCMIATGEKTLLISPSLARR
jgi:hypothetical protein